MPDLITTIQDDIAREGHCIDPLDKIMDASMSIPVTIDLDVLEVLIAIAPPYLSGPTYVLVNKARNAAIAARKGSTS